MKKFISFVMAAAMVASLVPATAFAAKGDEIRATARVVDAWDENRDFDGEVGVGDDSSNNNIPEAQIRINGVDYQRTPGVDTVARFTLRLDNAQFYKEDSDKAAALERLNNGIKVTLGDNIGHDVNAGTANYSFTEATTAQINALLEDRFDGTIDDTHDLYVISNSDMNAWTTAADPTQDVTATGGTETLLDATYLTTASVAAPNAVVSAQTNANTAFTAYAKATTANHGLNISDANFTSWGYVYKDDYNGFGAGWASPQGAATPTFVPLTDVISWVDTYSTTEGVTANMKASLNAAKDAFVATGDTDSTAWVNTARGTLTTYVSGQTSKIYKKTTTMVGESDATGSFRTVTASIESITNDLRKDEIIVTVRGPLEKDDVISVDLRSFLKTTSKTATFYVESDDIVISNEAADIVYVQVAQEGLVLSVRKTVDVAEDEIVTLDSRGLTIKTNVGNFRAGDITLKLSKGFEFAGNDFINNADGGTDWRVVGKLDGETIVNAINVLRKGDEPGIDADELIVRVDADDKYDEIVIEGIDVESTSAKSGSVATIRATCPSFTAAAAVEVIKVVDYKVVLSVDEDEDVPVIYSGVDTDNYGITDDSDHWSLEVTAKETFPGAWSFRKGFNFELPEGIYVTDVDVISTEGLLLSTTTAQGGAQAVTETHVFNAFFNAYQDGSHVNFEFDKRVFDDVDAKLNDDKAEMTFKLQLVADPGFEGDAVLKLTGELVEEQEVTIAKFIKPYEVKAEQNDIIIDYRYTDIPTAIVITEAEAGLWAKDEATFEFLIEKGIDSTFMSFEDDPTFEIDSKSGLAIKDDGADNGAITFTVKTESDEPATVTIKDMQLFMNRSIPAGPYDLSIDSSLADKYDEEVLFAPDPLGTPTQRNNNRYGLDNSRDEFYLANSARSAGTKEDTFVGDVCDYSDTVKEAFINVVTAGRDVDDASFTTKVVVPVGENYIIAGEKQVELDTPAYINEAGYTMLPIRAVATALGINNNNVLWDQPTKTVTILYGQRIITMTQGQKVVYVNGSAIPASAAVENTNSRTFLPMRDLATALGVTDITWDQATRTATLNGNQK